MLPHDEFTRLAEAYIDTVFRIALNYTRDPTDSEDITQNVFLKLCKEEKEFESDEHVRNWLIRVTVNECKRWLGAPWRQTVSLEDYTASLQDISLEHRDILRSVLALPRKYRMPIYLFYYEGYSTQEIAAILKIPKGTVCTNLDRGRKLLKLELEEDDFNA